MPPKLIKNRSTIDLKTCSKKCSLLAPIFHRFLMDLGTEMEEKSIQKRDVKGNTENYENCILASTKIKFLSPEVNKNQ